MICTARLLLRLIHSLRRRLEYSTWIQLAPAYFWRPGLEPMLILALFISPMPLSQFDKGRTDPRGRSALPEGHKGSTKKKKR
jgi:hypothetical protein